MVFQIDSICRENSDDDILNAIQDLPRDLSTTYGRILQQLRRSGSIDPYRGKKVCEIVAAARRPLSLEELREAISIEPGNTTWNASRLVNDVMKFLNCCGSLIVIDEEFSTVHFAHSSVKQYLEDRITIHYHIVPKVANSVLGEIVITYLNLDVLQGQSTCNSKSPTTLSTHDTSLLLGAGLSLSTGASSKLARSFLKNRKIPQFDVGRELEKAVDSTSRSRRHPLPVNSLLSYAQEHWLYHTISSVRGSYPLWELFERLINGDSKTVKVPWTSEDADTLNVDLLSRVANINNPPLTEYFFRRLLRQGGKGIHGVAELLELSNSQNSYKSNEKAYLIKALRLPKSQAETSLRLEDRRVLWLALQYAMAEESNTIVDILLDISPATIIYDQASYLLCIALQRGNLKIFETLLDYTADVNTAGGHWGIVMDTAAHSSIGEQAIPLLLAAGAREILIEDNFPKDVKHLLRRCYGLYKRPKVEGFGWYGQRRDTLREEQDSTMNSYSEALKEIHKVGATTNIPPSDDYVEPVQRECQSNQGIEHV